MNDDDGHHSHSVLGAIGIWIDYTINGDESGEKRVVLSTGCHHDIAISPGDFKASMCTGSLQSVCLSAIGLAPLPALSADLTSRDFVTWTPSLLTYCLGRKGVCLMPRMPNHAAYFLVDAGLLAGMQPHRMKKSWLTR